jgi:hypothetical protein
MKDEARRGMRAGWADVHYRRHGHSRSPWGCGTGWGHPPSWAAPPPPDPSTGEPAPPGAESDASSRRPPPPDWAPGRGWVGPDGRPVGPPGTGPSWHQHQHRPRRQRNPLPPVLHRWDATTVVGILAVLFGVAWLIGATGLWHMSIEGVVAVGLMLLGASLVVTGRTDWSLSRHSWPVWLGFGMIVVLIATSTTFGLGGALNNVSFGNSTVQVNSTPWPNGTIHGGFGDLTVNVTAPLVKDETLKVVSVAGKTTVVLPQKPNYNVTVDARVAAGQVCVEGQVANGPGAQYRGTLAGPPGTKTTLTLDVHESFGQIVIGSQGCAHS